MPSWSTYLNRADGVLGFLAVVGVLVYVGLLPRQHPDAAAVYALTPLEAQEIATQFLARHGYATDDLAVEAELRRSPDGLLDSLQAALGRPAIVQVLQTEVGEVLPAYYWQVRFLRHDAPSVRPGPEGEHTDRFRILLTLSGRVWAFHNERTPPEPEASDPEERLQQRVDREALQVLWGGEDGRLPPLEADLDAFSDTLLARLLFFDVRASRGDGLEPPPPDDPDRAERGRRGRRPLSRAEAEALARFHLERLLPRAALLRADSVWMPAERGSRLARVRFVSTEPVYGQHRRVEVGVSAGGALQALDVRFNTPFRGVEPAEAIVAGVTRVSLYLIFVVALLVVFFRRLVQRLIDVRAALVDGAVLGVLFVIGAAMNLGVAPIGVQASERWIILIGTLVTLCVMAGLVVLITFLLSGAADSVARAVWPEKLLTASLVRQGTVRNGYVGASLLRGLAMAGILLGVMTLVLAVVPHATLRLEQGAMLPSTWLRPMVGLAAFHGVTLYATLLLLLLGGATFFYRITGQRATGMIGLVALVAAPLHLSPALLGPLSYEWGASALFGALIAWTFWRYDLLTCFVGVFLAMLFWRLSEGWLMAGSPVGVDVVLAGLLAAGIGLAGVVGLIHSRRGADVAEYTPSYIRELTRQERMQRELEIAHQVQQSFLPHRMPRVEGVEVAAMCRAAQDVGGDYYDFCDLGDGRLAVAVGDVSGKGIQAAFYMTLTKGFLQTLCRSRSSPADVLRRLNALFYENVPRGIFISMIYGVLDVHARTFTFARAGHNPVILKRSPSQVPDLVRPAGMALGLAAGARFDASIEETTLHLRPGDVLVLYTDGFSEAANPAREQYGDARLARTVADLGGQPAEAVLQGIARDVERFMGTAGPHDDMTMVVLKLVDPGGEQGVDRAAGRAGASRTPEASAT
ncbi:MAG: hypothetical protein D6685_19435 [Bacteroidetes bacterium]|nr:MAG: hypothetical protein D6685_19435 [Bacteroidota bacterium]